MNILKSILAASFMVQAVGFADTITLKSGTKLAGTIKAMKDGQVMIEVQAATQTIALADVAEIDFDSPHLTEGTSGLPLEHFLKDLDAQELVKSSQSLTKARHELRTKLDEIKRTWGERKSVTKDEAQKWERTKADFLAVLSRYKEVLRDLDYHVLAHVENYNRIAGEARSVYVGVKGPLQVGSALIPAEAQELDPRRVLPQNWYDRIYYEAYREGFEAAKTYDRLTQ